MRSVMRGARPLAALPASISGASASAAAPAAVPARSHAVGLQASRLLHTAAALSAAPAAKPAAAAPAAGGKPGAAGGGGKAPVGPPARDSARWTSESWDAATLVPQVRPALKTAEESARDAAALAASRVLPELHAEVRERLGSHYGARLRSQHLRIPGIVRDRADAHTNHLLITQDRFELEALCRKYSRSVGHRVCLLHVAGQAAPLMVIPGEFQRHAVTQELLSVSWFLFKPRKERIKINIPIVYTGADECIGVKRGGVLVILRDSVPCVWTGDENIPQFIHIDLTHADGGRVFRNADFHLPLGLRLHSPETDYPVCTVLGLGAKGREEDEPAADAAAATPAAQQPSAIQIEKDKKAKERREEEEMVAQKLAQKAKK